jgi:predicted RNA-binding Zn ribbon-like protein
MDQSRFMNTSKSSAAEMRLVGGRLCLDFVNTVDGRKRDPARSKSKSVKSVVLGDKLGRYSDLVAWGRHSGVVTAPESAHLIKESKLQAAAARAVLDRAIELREALHRILNAAMMGRKPQSVDLEILNNELLQARNHERLVGEGKGFTWQWIGGAAALDQMLWPVANSAAEFLSTGDLSRLRECGGEECGWLFEDTSRNRSRQWCHMQDCGNLAKVRRFRTRLRSESKIRR